MQINKDDHYCYCSDILVNVDPSVVLDIIATGENHMRWASSKKREDSPGVWVGTSYFTGKDSIRLRFDVDHIDHFVDFMIAAPEDSNDDLRLFTWARALAGEKLGYEKGTSVLGLYQPRFADQNLETFFQERYLHASEMYRIKALAENNAAVSENALPTGDYLATASELIFTSPDTLFDFISDGMEYGRWTWGKSTRSPEGNDIFRCKQDFGGPDLLIRFEANRERKTVDYYVGENPDAMLLHQSARIFAGPDFNYDPDVSLVTFTRWRTAGQSNFEWDRDVLSHIIELKMSKEVLERN